MPSVALLKFVLQQVDIYVGLFILITSLIGSTLNIIIFTSLKTFREITCAFYLTCASIVGIGDIMTALLIRILSDGFLVDPRKITWFCKIYQYGNNWFFSVWLTCVCLATIDQFLSMSKYRHWSSLRLARRFVFIVCIFWFLHGSFVIIYWDASLGVCTVTNSQYSTYYSFFTLPILYGCLPISILITFSLLAFYRARTLASRQLNVVRSSRDRQLTAMILVYDIYIVIVLIPFTSFYVYSLNTNTTNAEQRATNTLIFAVTALIEYSVFAVSNVFERCHTNKLFLFL
jgi:hypothetical protein